MAGDDQDTDRLGQTPWQTVGPFFHYGLPWKGGADLIGASDLPNSQSKFLFYFLNAKVFLEEFGSRHDA